MHFDLLIKDGTVVDGSGKRPAFRADVGVIAGRIAAVGHIEGATATRTVDARGMIVAPGFIDVHVHSEIALLGGPGDRYGGLRQGVTTQFLAPDGFGWAPLAPQAAEELWEYTLFAYGSAKGVPLDWRSPEAFLALFKNNTPANVVPQVPHCAVRLAAMGWEPRRARPEELDHMRRLTRMWMETGAVGICLGLDYQPSASADTHELVELCKVVGEYGGAYAAHIRNQEIGKAAAWRETMEIGARSGIPVHISHEFVTDETAPLLDEAAERCDLTFESYLYRAGCTHMTLMLPIWAQAGGNDAMLARLKDAAIRRTIVDHLDKLLVDRVRAGGDAVFSSTQTGRYVGERISDLAAQSGESLGEFGLRVLEEEMPYALMIFHHGGSPSEQERIMEQTMRHPRMMVASDGIYHSEHPHPRGFGCFAQVLRLCVREKSWVSMEEAVYKMAGFPAERFGLKDRGRLAQGLAADLVVFDPRSVADRATWDRPSESPVGVRLVVVNGEVVVEDGTPTDVLPGRVIGLPG